VIPAWVDRREYPFTPRVLDVEGIAVRYVDEGHGPAVLMVHGTPTWSFLYRHLVTELAGRHRCVAPDLPGFGLSDKPRGISYRPQDQARRLTTLVDALGLRDLTLVVHDFGGPIGLAHAIERPASVRRLVLFNTWMWSLAGDARIRLMGRLLGSRLGRILFERFRFSTDVLWRRAIGDKSRYTPAVHAHYRAPLGCRTDRHATWAYARELLGSSAWYDALWARRDRIAGIPALLVWGMKDPAFGGLLPRWRAVFAQAEVVELPDVGHAPPEERGPEVAATVARFLAA
jgi:pimeloyl-ACP methyl ester carboxylesterase